MVKKIYAQGGKGCWLITLTLLLMFLPLTAVAAEPTVSATPFYMDFYGFIPSAQPGDTLTVQDADGVVCGVFTVKNAGKYGFVHVYGDDPSTPVDEGAQPGDPLTFLLNGKTLDGEPATWTADRYRRQMDFSNPE